MGVTFVVAGGAVLITSVWERRAAASGALSCLAVRFPGFRRCALPCRHR